jgi:hypothetical protein
VKARIVSGDALPGQRALLDHRGGNVARYKRGQFSQFGSARSGGLIATDRIPPGKRNILLDHLVVLRNRRHYQGPGHKHEHECVAQFHERDLPESKRPEQRPAAMTVLADKSVVSFGTFQSRESGGMADALDLGFALASELSSLAVN